MSCSEPQPLRDELGEAKFAFVGTVATTTDDAYAADVRVESIWLGERLPDQVEVRGRADSDPRSFVEGQRYLFVPIDRFGGPAPVFQDSACSATTKYTPAVARLEPDGAIGPYNERTPMWIGILIALLVVGAWQASKARRRVQGFEP